MPGPCFRCRRRVHAAEEKFALNSSWHPECFTCASCNKSLDSTTLRECFKAKEIYCGLCYKKYYVIPGYGYGPNGPTLQSVPQTTTRPRQDQRSASSASDLNPTTLFAELSGDINEDCPCPGVPCSGPESPPVPVRESFLTPPSRYGQEFTVHQPRPKHYTHQAVAPRSRTPAPRAAKSAVKLSAQQNQAVLCRPNQETVSSLCSHWESKLSSTHTKQGNGCCEPAVMFRNNNSPKQGPSPSSRVKNEGPCLKCGKMVFNAERVVGYCGIYHTRCFVCIRCRKTLDSTTVNEHRGDLYCKGCYKHTFGITGVGYGIGAGALQTS